MSVDLNQKVDPEVVKELTSPISFGKVVEKPSYDFDFITQSLGLIPIKNGTAAFNPGAVVDLDRSEDGTWLLSLHGDNAFDLTEEDMAELESTIKARAEVAKLIQKEAMKQNLKAQAEAVAELQQGVQPGMIVGAPGSKRWGKH